MTQIAEPAADAEETPWTWDGIHALIRRQKEADDQAKAIERARLMHIEPDGKTLHVFSGLPDQKWEYVSHDADLLIEWATTVVLARENPSQLGTIH